MATISHLFVWILLWISCQWYLWGIYDLFSFWFSWIHFDFVYVIFVVYNFFNQIMLQYRQDVNDGIFVFFVSLCVEWVRNFVLFDFAKFLNHYFVNYASNFHFFFLILIVFVSYIWSFFFFYWFNTLVSGKMTLIIWSSVRR